MPYDTDKFKPPPSEGLPAKGKALLKKVYGECRLSWVKEHPDDQENADNKAKCAKVAWSVVKKKYHKVDGKWIEKMKLVKVKSKDIEQLKGKAKQIFESSYDREIQRLVSRGIKDEQVLDNSASRMAWAALKQTHYRDENSNWVERYHQKEIKPGPVDHTDYWSCGRLPIMREGVHNDERYEHEDLVLIASNYSGSLPMGIGHGPQNHLSKLPEGLAHAGLIEKIYVEGDTLFADIDHIPKRIGDAIFLDKQWVKRSIVEGRGIDERKLYGADWLGMDPPAVEDLPDPHDMYEFKKSNNKIKKEGEEMANKEDKEKKDEEKKTSEKAEDGAGTDVPRNPAVEERLSKLEKRVEVLESKVGKEKEPKDEEPKEEKIEMTEIEQLKKELADRDAQIASLNKTMDESIKSIDLPEDVAKGLSKVKDKATQLELAKTFSKHANKVMGRVVTGPVNDTVSPFQKQIDAANDSINNRR